ncbi:hypothetical protein E1301_Tti015792 [Triplophysa tibetana]|uniref:Uncharacterized protein n=1 Tax=Triplophysa tibetana TaxID=1572043 RepID=A0A5A9P2Q3_9TELE|nr:hypothetical protein E1301_Tti015792 [Triplophysa tibetana]
MDLLEEGGRKFVELGSGSPPEEEEEEGADAAITPKCLSPQSKVHCHSPRNCFCFAEEKSQDDRRLLLKHISFLLRHQHEHYDSSGTCPQDLVP